MRISFQQAERQLLALPVPSILCREFWLDTNIQVTLRMTNLTNYLKSIQKK